LKKFLLLVLTIICFATTLTYAQQEDFVPQREKLLNGLAITLVERPRSGNIALNLVIKTGTTFDTVGKVGLADLTAQMLSLGAGGWTAERLKDELGDINARLEITTTWDATELRMIGPSANFEGLINILSQVVTQAKFREQDFATIKAERLKAFESATASVTLASEAFYSTLYGSHPYGHNSIGNKESVAQISHFDLADFYQRFYIANNSALVIVGEVSLERSLPILRKGFGGWRKGLVAPYTFVPPQESSGVNIHLIERPESATSELRLGNFALSRTDANYLPLQILIEMLDKRLAVQSGGKIEATLPARKMRSPFLISASVGEKDVEATLATILAEMKRLTQELDINEMQAAKNVLIAAYSSGLSKNTEIAARIAETENYNLGVTYTKNFATQVNKLSADQLRRVAMQYFNGENLMITILGRTGELASSLKKFGKVESTGTK
jgi:zinc protease